MTRIDSSRSTISTFSETSAPRCPPRSTTSALQRARPPPAPGCSRASLATSRTRSRSKPLRAPRRLVPPGDAKLLTSLGALGLPPASCQCQSHRIPAHFVEFAWDLREIPHRRPPWLSGSYHPRPRRRRARPATAALRHYRRRLDRGRQLWPPAAKSHSRAPVSFI